MSKWDPSTHRTSDTNLLMYIAILHLSLRDKVSAAIVEHHIFDEFQYSGQVQFFEYVEKIICPAWLPPFEKLFNW